MTSLAYAARPVGSLLAGSATDAAGLHATFLALLYRVRRLVAIRLPALPILALKRTPVGRRIGSVNTDAGWPDGEAARGMVVTSPAVTGYPARPGAALRPANRWQSPATAHRRVQTGAALGQCRCRDPRPNARRSGGSDRLDGGDVLSPKDATSPSTRSHRVCQPGLYNAG